MVSERGELSSSEGMEGNLLSLRDALLIIAGANSMTVQNASDTLPE